MRLASCFHATIFFFNQFSLEQNCSKIADEQLCFGYRSFTILLTAEFSLGTSANPKHPAVFCAPYFPVSVGWFPLVTINESEREQFSSYSLLSQSRCSRWRSGSLIQNTEGIRVLTEKTLRIIFMQMEGGWHQYAELSQYWVAGTMSLALSLNVTPV